MDSLLPELESFGLIHPTCKSTTSHQLRQREILASQPLIIFDLLVDETEDDQDVSAVPSLQNRFCHSGSSNISSELLIIKPISKRPLSPSTTTSNNINTITAPCASFTIGSSSSTASSPFLFSPIERCEKKRRLDNGSSSNNDNNNTTTTTTINLYFQHNSTKKTSPLKRLSSNKQHMHHIPSFMNKSMFSCLIEPPLEGIILQ
ncbi:hypothetical protein SAMD00019534_045300 [Acytostelium subglobosum LB1]|uniref:hypothetical protein n=1 Tax=Acytostelium subglobosum LB1 TaxID=1410327 RepID=UPI000644DA37|nr:hypothetical protein SAMD00019534_045300 [Acytostelium subglobosum LB1]GAM21355.1 hypothetical protein SAMD00019534_045300 [Acytostelium subglobosum LB1]|eukprot:XP_012755474.1 hypothetical protein SAMD00019534_045300 [Acytostelium subglobosum LB1]